MNDNNLISNLSLFLDKEGDDKINESLLSLRFMKKIDDFLELNNITNRQLSEELGFSESYISQLMTGTKKINVSFINKLENCYNVYFDVNIHNCDKFNDWKKVNLNSYIVYMADNDSQKTIDLSEVVCNVFQAKNGYSFEKIKEVENEK